MKIYALAAALLLLLGACQQGTEVVSPDGKNKLALSLDESGALSYRIWSGDKEIVQKSSMGLEAAHNRNIVHRDIKPQNIIISTEQNDYKTSIYPKVQYHPYQKSSVKSFFSYLI